LIYLIPAVAVALLGYLLVRGGKARPVLVVTVKLAPTGQSEVRFVPESSEPALLRALLLCYGAKIRWLLNNEPAEIAEMFEELVGEAIDFWAEHEDDLLAVMPTASQLRAQIDVPFTVPAGEQFSVRLFTGPSGQVYVLNDLPRPGLAINFAWHFIVLMDAVRSRLSESERVALHQGLQDWYDLIFSPAGQDSSFGALKNLNEKTNDLLKEI